MIAWLVSRPPTAPDYTAAEHIQQLLQQTAGTPCCLWLYIVILLFNQRYDVISSLQAIAVCMMSYVGMVVILSLLDLSSYHFDCDYKNGWCHEMHFRIGLL